MTGFIYIATPYAKYVHGRSVAAKHAAQAAGQLLSAGILCFSPIAHSHQISVEPTLRFEGDDHARWMEIDEPFMRLAVGMLLVQMDGWRDSAGVDHEKRFFVAAGKPVYGIQFPFTGADIRRVKNQARADGLDCFASWA